jgi:hypothetical protein
MMVCRQNLLLNLMAVNHNCRLAQDMMFRALREYYFSIRVRRHQNHLMTIGNHPNHQRQQQQQTQNKFLLVL